MFYTHNCLFTATLSQECSWGLVPALFTVCFLTHRPYVLSVSALSVFMCLSHFLSPHLPFSFSSSLPSRSSAPVGAVVLHSALPRRGSESLGLLRVAEGVGDGGSGPVPALPPQRQGVYAADADPGPRLLLSAHHQLPG